MSGLVVYKASDCNMTILVPGDAAITIEGEPITLGDWLGVFYWKMLQVK